MLSLLLAAGEVKLVTQVECDHKGLRRLSVQLQQPGVEALSNGLVFGMVKERFRCRIPAASNSFCIGMNNGIGDLFSFHTMASATLIMALNVTLATQHQASCAVAQGHAPDKNNLI